MFDKAPGVGLDIGSQKTKLARVKIRKGNIELVRFGSMNTPQGVMEAGNLLDPDRLGQEMNTLVRELGLKGQRVVSAVSGQQVYTRTLVMPQMNVDDLKEAVNYQAMNFLPIPVEEASIDMLPLREFEDQEGKKIEVFFVAVRRQQVENLYAACQMAGLKLAAVEIEPLALLRVLGQDYRQQDLMALLHIGASRSHFSVFNNGILVFYRFLSFGCAPFFRGLGDAVPNDNINMGYIELNQDSEYDFLVRDMIAEVSRSIEYFNMQSGGKIGAVETILLCGGGTRIKGLDISLEEGLGLGVMVVNPLENIILNPDTTDADKNKLKHDFAVALGLAARRSI